MRFNRILLSVVALVVTAGACREYEPGEDEGENAGLFGGLGGCSNEEDCAGPEYCSEATGSCELCPMRDVGYRADCNSDSDCNEGLLCLSECASCDFLCMLPCGDDGDCNRGIFESDSGCNQFGVCNTLTCR